MHHSIDSLESRLVLSAPVDLDPTFADGGTFAPPALTGSSRPIDSTMLTDGRTLVLSLIGEPITSDDLANYATTFAVQRFLANGAIDQTFGTNGTSLVFRRLEATNATIKVAPSGHIFVAAQYGYSFSEESGVRLARLNAQGNIDRSFGRNGVLSIALRGEYFVQPRLAFTGSRIYVAQEQYNPAQKFTVAALRNDGAFDSSFGSSGIFEFTSTQQENLRLQNIFASPQGDLLLAGGAYSSIDGYRAFAVRLTAAGALDATYGTSGIARFEQAPSSVVDVELDAQSRLVFGFEYATVARLSADGAVDATFGVNGLAEIKFGRTYSRIFDLSIDSLSRVYVLGDNGRPALHRLTAAGAADNSYGKKGASFVLQALRAVRGVRVEVNPTNNSATVVGRAFYFFEQDFYYDTRGHVTPVLARITARGRFDLTYGDAGVAGADVAGKIGRFIDLKTLSDGKILALGRTLTPRGEDFMVYRFTADGAVDSTFAAGRGFALIDFAGGHDVAARMEVQPDGKIIVAGATTNADRLNDWAIARLNADGSIDTSFGTAGKVVLNLRGALEQVVSIALLSNGKFLTTGNTEGQIATVRFTRNGAIDRSFGVDGISLTSPRIGESSLSAQSMIVLNDGRILVYGVNRNSSSDRGEFFVRYSANGNPDTTFGRDGRRMLPYQGFGYATAMSRMLKLESGEILFQFGDGNIGRLRSDGTFDSVFGNAFAGEMAIQRDGKVVIANDALQRLNPHGSTDATFNPRGSYFEARLRAVALTANEKILFAGEESLVPTLIRTLGKTATRPKIASLQNGDLSVIGTTSADRIDLVRDGSRLRVTRNGDFVTFDFNAVRSVTIDALESDDHIAVQLDKNNITVNGGEGNDTLDASAAARGLTLVGGTGADSLVGGKGNDSLDGGDGDDILIGNGGADVFVGGADSDSADYSARTIGVTVSKDNLADDGAPGERDDVRSDVEIVVGSRGNDLLIGSINRDTLMGMEGNDTLRGGASRDSLYGDGGNDLLLGEEGNDSLDGGDGVNSLFGNAGNDSLLAGPGRDQFTGGTGFDFVFYGSYSVGKVSEFGNIFAAPSFIRRVANVREDALRLSLDGLANDGAPGERDLIGADIEALFGGNGNDFITGSTIGNRLDGRGGDDTVNGGAGNDTITDEDRRNPESLGHDLLQGGDGDDILVSRDFLADTLDGGAGFDQINAGFLDTLLNYELLSGQQ